MARYPKSDGKCKICGMEALPDRRLCRECHSKERREAYNKGKHRKYSTYKKVGRPKTLTGFCKNHPDRTAHWQGFCLECAKKYRKKY